MDDREKALELVQKCLDDWPYATTRVVEIMKRLEWVKVLLKAQEPIKLREEETKLSKMYGKNIFRNYYCGQCNHPLDHIIWRDKYCPECGRKVLWND